MMAYKEILGALSERAIFPSADRPRVVCDHRTQVNCSCAMPRGCDRTPVAPAW
jgi:hypothetical protein